MAACVASICSLPSHVGCVQRVAPSESPRLERGCVSRLESRSTSQSQPGSGRIGHGRRSECIIPATGHVGCSPLVHSSRLAALTTMRCTFLGASAMADHHPRRAPISGGSGSSTHVRGRIQSNPIRSHMIPYDRHETVSVDDPTPMRLNRQSISGDPSLGIHLWGSISGDPSLGIHLWGSISGDPSLVASCDHPSQGTYICPPNAPNPYLDSELYAGMANP